MSGCHFSASSPLARFDKFREVVLNFRDVSSIGQAFADEIFRVFMKQNPDVNITYVNATKAAELMILRALHSED